MGLPSCDTEWCLRVRSMGYKIYGACFAIMRHNLGSYQIPIWFLRWRMVSVHEPFRYYYIVRNSLLLHRRDYPDKRWRMFEMQRLFQIILFFGLFVPGRVSRLRMIVKGFRDGLYGVTGKLKDWAVMSIADVKPAPSLEIVSLCLSPILTPCILYASLPFGQGHRIDEHIWSSH